MGKSGRLADPQERGENIVGPGEIAEKKKRMPLKNYWIEIFYLVGGGNGTVLFFALFQQSHSTVF
jgi:hypothetical protein